MIHCRSNQRKKKKKKMKDIFMAIVFFYLSVNQNRINNKGKIVFVLVLQGSESWLPMC